MIEEQPRKTILDREPSRWSNGVRAIIALWHMGVRDKVWIAEALGKTPEAVGKLLRNIRQSKKSRIQKMLKEGLPPGLSADLTGENARMRCPRCRNWINVVPCQSCVARSEFICEVAEEWSGPAPPLPKVPTRARPGSLKKKRVLQLRLLLGEALFHPEDRVVGLVERD